MRPRHRIIAWLIALLCAGCAPLPRVHAPTAPTTTGRQQTDTGRDLYLSPARVGALVGAVSGMDATAAEQEIVRLQQGMARRGPAERLKLAALLGRRENGTLEDLRRADTLMDALIPGLENDDSRALARLLQRNIRLQLSLEEEHEKVAEFSRKIQQLKGLEEELQQHNATPDPAPDTPDK